MPNENKRLNFVAKVYDPIDKKYKPIYIAPDATDKVQGDVKLSDATNGTQNAATGMTAATPAAVKAVQASADNKLDKTSATAQTVASGVTFNGSVTLANGATIPSGKVLTGNVSGNASTATKLATARTISVSAGGTAASGSFDGSGNLSLAIGQVAASTLTGTIDLARLPQGALERLVKVANQAARFKLTSNDVQLGDSVLQTDTGIMYIVVDQDNLGNANGYQEYKAGTATSVPWTGVTDKPSTFAPSAHTHPFSEITGTIADSQIADASIAGEKLKSSSVGHSKITPGAISGDLVRAKSLTGASIADATLATDHFKDGCVTTVKVADAAITAAKIAGSAVTRDKIADGAVDSAKIADGAVSLGKLSDVIGVVQVSTAEPTDSHVKIWVKASA